MDFETSRIWECGKEERSERRERALGRKETERMIMRRKKEIELGSDVAIVARSKEK